MKLLSDKMIDAGKLVVVLFFLMASCKTQNTTATVEKADKDTVVTVIPHSTVPPAMVHGGNEEEVLTDEAVADPDIVLIKQQYSSIRKMIDANSLRKDTKNFECADEPGGGHLIRYYQGTELVFLDHVDGGEHSWEQQRIYFKDGKPFFIFEEKGSWGFGGPINDSLPNSIDKVTENRYYIKNGEVIRKLTKNIEEHSWEKTLKSADVRNKVEQVQPGTKYPEAASIPQWVAGKVGC